MANIGELESSKLTTQKYFFWRQEKLEIFLLVLKNSSSSKFQVFLAKTLQSFLFQKIYNHTSAEASNFTFTRDGDQS